jgi:hypothetical protein
MPAQCSNKRNEISKHATIFCIYFIYAFFLAIAGVVVNLILASTPNGQVGMMMFLLVSQRFPRTIYSGKRNRDLVEILMLVADKHMP